MAIAWPAGVPARYIRAGYAFTPGQAVIRSPMDAGPPFQRRFTTNPGDQHTIQLKLTSTQWDLFFPWWRDTLGRGSLTFDWPAPYGIGTIAATFVGDRPPSKAPWPSGPFHSVTFTLEV